MNGALGVIECLVSGAWLTARNMLLQGLTAPAKARQFYYNHVASTVGAMLLERAVESGRATVLETDAAALLGNGDPVTLFGVDSSSYTVSSSELVVLCGTVRSFRPQRILEFGTYLGNTTLHLAANADDTARIYTVDLPPGTTPPLAFDLSRNDQAIVAETTQSLGVRFRGTPYERKITQILADSAAYDFRQIEDAFDLVFIDASHQYEYVKKDSETALRLLAPGGFIFWHDYVSPIELPDVFRYLNELGTRNVLHHIRGTRLVYFRNGEGA